MTYAGRLLAAAVLCATLPACGDDSDPPDAAAADAAAVDAGAVDAGAVDVASDAAPPSCSACTSPVCLTAVSGAVRFADGSPFVGKVQLCVRSCFQIQTELDGHFRLGFDSCVGMDFAPPVAEEGIHVTLRAPADGAYTRYSASYKPTQAQVSDLGPDDFELDTGTHYYYPLPDESFPYTASAGATVATTTVSMVVPAAAIGPDDLSINVLELPLAEWTPPFVPAGVSLDGLLFLGPYFSEVSAPVTLSVSAAALGWADGDTGTVYQLGDYIGGETLSCDGAEVETGVLGGCGSATAAGGWVTTAITNRLTWVGFARDPGP
jgi:FlaG/FlaF family flagellin (archaellin)